MADIFDQLGQGDIFDQVTPAKPTTQFVGGQGMFGGGFMPQDKIDEDAAFAKQAVGSLTKGGMKLGQAMLEIPKHTIWLAGNIMDLGPGGEQRTFEEVMETIPGTKGITEKYLGVIKEHKRGQEAIIAKHPEWEYEPPESFLDLLTHPKKLALSIAESTPMLVGAGIMTAAGRPDVSMAMIYGVEGQEAHDQAIAEGASEEEASYVYHAYGLPAALIEQYLRIKPAIKLSKDAYNRVLNRTAQKIARSGKRISKGTGLELVKEAIEEPLQGAWQEITAKEVYGKEIPGGIGGFIDRRAQEAYIGTVMGLMPGAGGKVAGAAVRQMQPGVEVTGVTPEAQEIPPGSNVYRGVESGRVYIETPQQMGAKETQITEEVRTEEGTKIISKETGEELETAEGLTVSGRADAPPLETPTEEEITEALPTEEELAKKPRMRVRAEPRSKKELLWRGHALPEAFGLDEDSRRDMMEEVTGKRSMKDMSPEEQESFVAYTEALAEQSGIEIDAPVIDRAIERLESISKKKEALTPTEELHRSNISKLVGRVKAWGNEAYNVMRRMERLIESLDGEENGVLHENVWKPVKAADETRVLNTAAGTEEYTRLLDNNSIDLSILLGRVENIAPGVKLTRDEQIGVYLHYRNKHSHRYLNEGMDISDEVIDEVIGGMSQTDLMIGDWMHDKWKEQWPLVVAIAEQVGIDPEVLIEELDYAPIIRSDVDMIEQVDFVDMLTDGFTKESYKPEQGFLEKRKKRAIGKIELSASVMYLNNVKRIETFKAMAPVAKKVGKILNNPDFKRSLNDATYGSGSKLMNTWLRDAIKGHAPYNTGWFAKTLNTLRRNAIVYAIGWNIPSSLRQTLSMSNAMAVNPAMLKHVPSNLARATKDFSTLKDEVYAKSNLVSTRDYERDLRQKWTKSDLYKRMKGKDPFDKKATAWIRWMDNHTVVVAWKSLYDTAIELGKDEKAAIEYADKWIARTQPMANAKDLPQFFRDGELAKIVSAFQNQVNNNFNFYTHDIVGAKLSPQMTAYRLMFSWVLPAIAFGMIGRGGLPKSWEQLAIDLVTYPIATLMLIGRLINRAIMGWDNSTSIVETAPEEAMRTAKALARGDIKGTINHAAKTVGAATGRIPTAQMSRTFTGAMDLAAGDTKDPRRLIWSEWALSQGKKSESVGRRPPVRRPPVGRPPG